MCESVQVAAVSLGSHYDYSLGKPDRGERARDGSGGTGGEQKRGVANEGAEWEKMRGIYR